MLESLTRLTTRQRVGVFALAPLLLLAPLTIQTAARAIPAIAEAASGTVRVSLSGAYTGSANVQGLTEFGEWRGAPTPVALDYLGNDGWQDIADPDWTLNAWRTYDRLGGTLVLSVPMLVNSPVGSFATGATGAYDRYYRSLGHQLVADGYGHAVLRLGWEFNGTWFPWSLNRTWSPDGPRAFVAYWRHLVDLLRAIPGSHFRFDWTVNPGSSSVPAAAAYPGNKYVSYVGVDVYDSSYANGDAGLTNATQRWDQIANQRYGLNWWLRFAGSHGKPITLPEWGLNTNQAANGAGDDPSFIKHMYDWIVRNQPAYQIYFDYGASELDESSDPRASAEYRKLFGDRRALPARK